MRVLQSSFRLLNFSLSMALMAGFAKAANSHVAGRDCPDSTAIFNSCLTPVWDFSPITSQEFNWDDGATPTGDLVATRNGLVGTTTFGGENGYGTVFAVSSSNTGVFSERIVYSFSPSTSDGRNPFAGLVADAKTGALYGTTSAGGTGYCFTESCGTVFELAPRAKPNASYTETFRYDFQGDTVGGIDGQTPLGGLIEDGTGALYGTTYNGGAFEKGVVFKLTPSKRNGFTESILYSFGAGGTGDGAHPAAGLVARGGNLFGTTSAGGSPPCSCGTVFELSPAQTGYRESFLYSFKGAPVDGSTPYAGLVFGSGGQLFGTTYYGGIYGSHCDDAFSSSPSQCGTVFELTPSTGGYVESLVLCFQGGAQASHRCPGHGVKAQDGANPDGGVAVDPSTQALYGTTTYGGSLQGACVVQARYGSIDGCGIVYELVPSGKGYYAERLAYVFTNAKTNDGVNPQGGLLYGGSTGIFYGSTAGGGNTKACSPLGCGTTFELTPTPAP